MEVEGKKVRRADQAGEGGDREDEELSDTTL